MNNFFSKIVLGTAQLGSHYGITNYYGKPSKKETFKILDLAWEVGIRSFDTAASYDSESVLGEFINCNGIEKESIILTKFSLPDDLDKSGSKAYRAQIIKSIEISCQNLSCNINTLFFHKPNDAYLILEDSGFFKSLCKNYKINEIGISVYETKEV